MLKILTMYLAISWILTTVSGLITFGLIYDSDGSERFDEFMYLVEHTPIKLYLSKFNLVIALIVIVFAQPLFTADLLITFIKYRSNKGL